MGWNRGKGQGIQFLWPDGEVIYSDAFPGPEHMLSAGHAAMIEAARKALMASQG